MTPPGLMVVAALAAAPPELGIVRWQRDFEAGARAAKAQGKPMLLLFDEVPGCSTVLGFGERVLSHPLIADAAERELIAVVVYNNVGGDDRKVLERFAEPQWNNPVVWLLAPDGRRLQRLDVPTAPQLAVAMAGALAQAGRPVPEYLALLAQEQPARRASATFSMGCFWEGESALGGIDGVVSTTPGFANGHEVVRVEYDAARLEPGKLQSLAKQRGYSEAAGDFRASANDDKYQLRGTALERVPLTALQKARLNADAKAAVRLLSPRQLEALRQVEGSPGSWPDLRGVADLADAWRRYERASKGPSARTE